MKELEREEERRIEGKGVSPIWRYPLVGAFLIYKRGIRFFIALFAPLFQQAWSSFSPPPPPPQPSSLSSGFQAEREEAAGIVG